MNLDLHILNRKSCHNMLLCHCKLCQIGKYDYKSKADLKRNGWFTTMNVNNYAEILLFGNTLQDKLFRPKKLNFMTQKDLSTDFLPPRTPGRPTNLTLQSWHERQKVPFPNIQQLENQRYRGIVFHFFANHELLAIELMALLLLKFPHTPIAFQRGISSIIQEEQLHLSTYLEYMKKNGIELGEIPVNDFFWSILKDTPNPMDFIAHMSLTFEQANLDFAMHYKNLFTKLCDLEAAEILQKIYDDEIGHVKHGLSWFKHWKPKHLSTWNAYLKTLRFPMTPQRAKGTGFDLDGRRRAGFSEHYIESLQLYSSSKGRPPRLYLMNINCEAEILQKQQIQVPSKNVIERNSDLSMLTIFLASQEDICIIEQQQSREFLTDLKRFGFILPEIITIEPNPLGKALKILELQNRKISSIEPWGWSPKVQKQTKTILNNLCNNQKKPTLQPDAEKIHSKLWSSELLKQLQQKICYGNYNNTTYDEQNSVSAYCYEEVFLYIEKVLTTHSKGVVLKSPLGSNGNGIYWVSNENKNSANLELWIKKTLRLQKTIVIEPWLNKILDVSTQIKILENGQIKKYGTSHFVNNACGQYSGTLLGKVTKSFSTEICKALYGDTNTVGAYKILETAAHWVGERLFHEGYIGPAGIDAMLYLNSQNHIKCKPIIEINPRYTMGRVALELQQHMASGSCGLWIHLRIKDILKAGYNSALEFLHTIQKDFPLNFSKTTPAAISCGAIFTNDPSTAHRIVTLLLIDEDYTKIRQCIKKIIHHFNF